MMPCGLFATAQIVVIGDSLSSGYKMDPKLGWVNLINNKLTECNLSYEMVNLSTSGDTTRIGLEKLSFALENKPEIVIIELGGNDGLRGVSLKSIHNNLNKMIEQSLDSGSIVLLLGIKLPPNYGASFTKQFHNIYQDLAKQHSLPFVSFILEGVAQNKSLMRSDGIHPTSQAQPFIANHVWSTLSTLLPKQAIKVCGLP